MAAAAVPVVDLDLVAELAARRRPALAFDPPPIGRRPAELTRRAGPAAAAEGPGRAAGLPPRPAGRALGRIGKRARFC
jgi:hypothetical protein